MNLHEKTVSEKIDDRRLKLRVKRDTFCEIVQGFRGERVVFERREESGEW